MRPNRPWSRERDLHLRVPSLPSRRRHARRGRLHHLARALRACVCVWRRDGRRQSFDAGPCASLVRPLPVETSWPGSGETRVVECQRARGQARGPPHTHDVDAPNKSSRSDRDGERASRRNERARTEGASRCIPRWRQGGMRVVVVFDPDRGRVARRWEEGGDVSEIRGTQQFARWLAGREEFEASFVPARKAKSRC